MKQQFTIEKGIPLPSTVPQGYTATLMAMEIGDSFWADKSPSEVHGHFKQAKKSGLKFSCRSEVKDGVKGCRVWRVA